MPTRAAPHRTITRKGRDILRVHVGPGEYTDYTLGPTGSAEAEREKRRLLQELAANGAPPPKGPMTVASIAARYTAHAEEAMDYRDAHRASRAWSRASELYGTQPASSFGPKALKATRASWVDEGGLSRQYVNKLAASLRAGFRWAVAEELVAPDVLTALQTVEELRRGKTEAREAPKVKAAVAADVERTIKHLSPVVAAIVRLQMLTGMRPAEVIALRPQDLDRRWMKVGRAWVWLYRLDSHKNDWRGHMRWVPIGPRAQRLLRPWLKRPEGEYCFSPRESVAWWRAQRSERQRTSRTRGPTRRYSSSSYARAVRAACDTAGVPRWSPNQLRHLTATQVEVKYGREDARCVLGHSTPTTTAIYAEWVERAARVMAEVG
jgi:integrase